jgi:ABC-2 type transport system permease protein
MSRIIQEIWSYSHKPIAFLRRDFIVATGYRLQFVGQFVSILVTTFMFFSLSKLIDQDSSPYLSSYGGDYFSFVLIGIALSDFLFVSVSTFAKEVRQAQMIGTFEAMLVTPTPISTILFSSYLYTFLSSLSRIMLYFVIGWLFFDFQANPDYLLLFIFTIIVSILPFLGIGLISAAFIIVFKQGSPVTWLVGTFSGLLAGVMYPVAVLPDWVQSVSNIIPLTYGLEAVRMVLLQGATVSDISMELTILALFTVVLLGLGLLAVNYSLRIARRDGTLLHY